MRTFTGHALGAVFLLMSAPSSQLLAGPMYTLTDLGYLPGGNNTHAQAINSNGLVVGYSGTGSPTVVNGFIWNSASGMTLLGTFGGTSSFANSINNSGHVTGWAFGPSDQSAAGFIYSNGSFQSLGTLGGSYSYGVGINNSDHIVGNSNLAGNVSSTGFLYKDGSMNSIGTLGGSNSIANDINSGDVIVGSSQTAISGSYFRAFVESNGVMLQLPDLGDFRGSEARGINDSGQIVGYSYAPGGNSHALLWQNGGFTDLGTLGGSYSVAENINGIGQIVGYSETAGHQEMAFLYSSGTMYDLNQLVVNAPGWTLGDALDINDRGQIVGVGAKVGDLYGRGFLLSPVSETPEPRAFSMLAIGMVSLLLNRRLRTVG